MSLGAVAVVVSLAGCVGGKVFGIFGPDKKDDEKGGKFAVGNSISFVTTGGASQDTPDDITFIVDEFSNRMSFNARGGENATGVFNFTGRRLGQPIHIHGDIVCYAFLNNQALVRGHITSSDPAQPVGEDNDAVWIVEDNGEGSVLQKDRISLWIPVTHGPVGDCTTALLVEGTMYPIETGNVQIHN
jgi:hypothetical protein